MSFGLIIPNNQNSIISENIKLPLFTVCTKSFKVCTKLYQKILPYISLLLLEHIYPYVSILCNYESSTFSIIKKQVQISHRVIVQAILFFFQEIRKSVRTYTKQDANPTTCTALDISEFTKLL